jgi:hypothetical protein
VYEAPSPSGVHSFSKRHRYQSACEKDRPRYHRQLRLAHKHPKVLEWLARHPRFVFHFTPTSASWLNAVEGLFALLTKRRLKRGVFRSLQELKEAIHSFIDHTNGNPQPFMWTKDPDKIIAAVKRGHQVLDSIH